jgi:hypothetical protein
MFPVIVLENVVGVTVTVNVTTSPMDGEGSEAVIVVVVFDATANAAGAPTCRNERLAAQMVMTDNNFEMRFI